MEFTLPTFVWTIINFLVLLLILSRFFFKPVNNMIEERNERIKKNIEQAEMDKKKAKEFEIEKENEYRKAKEEGKSIVEEYKIKADKVYQEIIDEAHKEAETILERARKEIEIEQEKAEEDLKVKTVDLAIELSKKALEQSLNEEEHRKLIDDFIAKVGN